MGIEPRSDTIYCIDDITTESLCIFKYKKLLKLSQTLHAVSRFFEVYESRTSLLADFYLLFTFNTKVIKTCLIEEIEKANIQYALHKNSTF